MNLDEHLEGDSTVLENGVKLLLDVNFGPNRPPVAPDSQWWYNAQLKNGLSDGLIERVRANHVGMVEIKTAIANDRPKVKLPWQFYGTIVTSLGAVLVAVLQQS